MTFQRWLIPLFLVVSSVCHAVDKEIVQLQRDVALLNEDLRTLQRSIDERMGAMMALLQQTLDRVNEVHTANTVIQSTFTDRLRQQEETVSIPVANLGAKLDQVVSGSLAVSENIADLNTRLKGLEQKLVDVENAVRIMQSPPPPPPSASEVLGGPPAGVTAQGLFHAAMRDQLAGNYDLALQEFQDYLRYFGNTELAAASQFHVGEIAFYTGDRDAALEAFDFVLKQYPRSGKAPDALYLKAKVLEQKGKRAQAVQELNRLVRVYPNSDAANRAQSELRRLRAVKGTSKAASRK